MVFINKTLIYRDLLSTRLVTLSTETSYQQGLIVGNLGPGPRTRYVVCQVTEFNSTSNVLVCVTHRKEYMYGCVSEWVGSVCVWCVCVLFVDLFQDDLRCLFDPHQVNHGGWKGPNRFLTGNTTRIGVKRQIGSRKSLRILRDKFGIRY
jgi:hypothetical protein